jgi:hypothetical protein
MNLTRVIVPHWFVLVVLSPPVAWRFHSWLRRRRRLRRGQCPRCGYDLTANATGVCPECGHIVPVPAPKSASEPASTPAPTEPARPAPPPAPPAPSA